MYSFVFCLTQKKKKCLPACKSIHIYGTLVLSGALRRTLGKKSILCRHCHCLCLVRGSVPWLHYIYEAPYFSYHFPSQAGLPVRPTEADLWCGTGVPCMFIGWIIERFTGNLTHVLWKTVNFTPTAPSFVARGPTMKRKERSALLETFTLAL